MCFGAKFIPKILLRKIPRLNKNSQAILKIRESGENENTYVHKYRKNFALRLMATLYQNYSLTESEFESPVTTLTQKVIIPLV